jgi:5-methyltetrahydropteroyltriglutamate--homocysteine methyltransferase
MCAALAARKDPTEELEFAIHLINEVARGLEGVRTGIHVCRGNWSRNEEKLLAGAYHPLIPCFQRMNVTQLVLEYASPRAGELCVVPDKELGLGVVNPRTSEIESPESIVARVRAALRHLPPDRVFLNPDCGFGTFATRPMNSPETARAKIGNMACAAALLRREL